MGSNGAARSRVRLRRGLRSLNSSPAAVPGPNPTERTIFREVDFIRFEDGTVAELIEDGKNPGHYMFAALQGDQIRYVQGVRTQDEIFVPLSSTTEFLCHTTLATAADDSWSLQEICGEIMKLLQDTLELEPGDYILASCFVIATCLVEKLPTAPYLALVGPPSSGKTTALRILKLLCRRSVLTADVSAAAFYRLCDKLTPTLLIDETASLQNKSELLHLLRSGSTQGIVSLRKGSAYKTYGARVVAWPELPNDAALNSRFLVIPMKCLTGRKLLSPVDPTVLERAKRIRNALLAFRLKNLENSEPPESGRETELLPRTQDLYLSLSWAVRADKDLCKILFALVKKKESLRESLPPHSAAVLDAVYRAIHLFPNARGYSLSELTKQVNEYLQNIGEPSSLIQRNVGNILTSFNLTNRTRTNIGYFLWLNGGERGQVHLIAENYKSSLNFVPFNDNNCRFCAALKNPQPTVNEDSSGPRQGEKSVRTDRQSEHGEPSEHKKGVQLEGRAKRTKKSVSKGIKERKASL